MPVKPAPPVSAPQPRPLRAPASSGPAPSRPRPWPRPITAPPFPFSPPLGVTSPALPFRISRTPRSDPAFPFARLCRGRCAVTQQEELRRCFPPFLLLRARRTETERRNRGPSAACRGPGEQPGCLRPW